MAKAAYWTMTDVEARKRGEQILGAVMAKADVTSLDSMMEAIRIELGEKKARFLEGNKKALQAGMDACK